MSFLLKHLAKSDPMSRIFRHDPTPYKIELYYMQPAFLQKVRIFIRKPKIAMYGLRK